MPKVEVVNEKDRIGYFECRLREIWVGDSPSRPWGILVPILSQPVLGSAVSSPAAHIHAPEFKTPKHMTDIGVPSPAVHRQEILSPTPVRPKGKCPFDHSAFTKEPEAADATLAEEMETLAYPHMNGNIHHATVQQGKVGDHAEPKVQASVPTPAHHK